MKLKNKKFLTMLEKSAPGSIGEEFDMLLKKHDGPTIDFLEGLILANITTKERAARIWGDSINYAYVDPLITVVTREAIECIPAEIARRAEVIGLYLIQGVLTVGTADPTNQILIRQLENITGKTVSPVFSLPCEIKDAIEIHYTTEKGVAESIEAFEKTEGGLIDRISREDLTSLAESASVTKMLEALIFFAIKERTSDIHIEPMEDHSRVRFRVDGRLQQMFTFSKAIQVAFNSRLKILCRVDVAESRFPQDGSFSMPMGTNSADFRVSFLPTIYGNKVVLRILASTGRKEMMTLDQMLMSQTVLQPFRRIIKNPNGIVFVTGPTGSGKTTTLYAALQEIHSPDKNISTIEDPVEIKVEGLTQSQVNHYIDLDFSLLLRSLMRQDPDIILIGEIRDRETAKIATEAALTGHLVLSTLHTNTAIQAIVRMVEIGIPPYMVAPSIIAVLAQRLAARICEKCRESYFPSQDMLQKYFNDCEGMDVPFYSGQGCNNCRLSGYSGRIAFHELVLVSDEMRSLIAQNAGTSELLRAAKKLGFRSLRYDGLKKMLLGLTTVQEVEKHTALEWME